MGFESADEIREALLAVVSTDMLQPQGQNAFGDRYQASVPIMGQTGLSRQILTVWIVLFGKDVARFVTAFPDRKGGQQ